RSMGKAKRAHGARMSAVRDVSFVSPWARFALPTLRMIPSSRWEYLAPQQRHSMPTLTRLMLPLLLLLCSVLPTAAQGRQQTSAQAAAEERYYRIVTIPVPEDIVLEVGGMATLPGGLLAVATRRGEIWTIEDPYME